MTRTTNRIVVYRPFDDTPNRDTLENNVEDTRMHRTLRWGIIGCGDVVERKSGPSIRQTGGSSIVAVMRRDGEKARQYAENHGIPLWTNRASEVIENPDVDIVYVATPPSSHLEYVLAASAAGKHVLVEKPMAMSADQARKMIAACDSSKVHLFVAYYRRFYPHVQEMKRLIEGSVIGVPVQSFIDIAADTSGELFSWRDDPAISGGGRFVDTGSHRLDAMLYLLGEIGEIHGLATTFDETSRVEQTVSLCVKFESGAQCSVTGDFFSGRTADRFVIVGTRGTITSDPLDGHAFRLDSGDGTKDFAYESFAAPHLGLIRHIERVVAGEAENECSGRDGMQTEIILDKAVRRNIRG